MKKKENGLVVSKLAGKVRQMNIQYLFLDSASLNNNFTHHHTKAITPQS